MKKRHIIYTVVIMIGIIAACTAPMVRKHVACPKFRHDGSSDKSKKSMSYADEFYTEEEAKPYNSPDLRPVEHNTESYDAIFENDFLAAKENPLSTFSIDVDNASYTNTRRFINNSQMPPKDAVRIEEFVNYFNYDYPQPKDEHPFAVYSEVGECPWNADHQLIHIGLQGKKYNFSELPNSNLVFLLDVSGSMGDKNKLPLLKQSFKLMVQKLRANDKVAIVVYAGAAGMVLDATPGDQKDKILNALNKLEAGGSTAGGEGIQLAYKIAKENYIEGGINRVILATDGDFNVGPSSNAEMTRLIEKKREEGIFVTVLGFGMGNYKDSRMEAIADHGNGNYFYIDNIDEAQKALVTEIDGTLYTIAKDVKLQLEFNPTKVKSYRLIGYENRMLKKEDFNDDTKDAGELGAGHTVTAIYEIVPAGSEEEASASVDPLKYQNTEINNTAYKSSEWLTVKFRYKKPDATKSNLIETVVKGRVKQLDKTSDNFRFSAAVASFGMLLRDSKYKGNYTYDNVIELAKNAKGDDLEGYRSEFVRLVNRVSLLTN